MPCGCCASHRCSRSRWSSPLRSASARRQRSSASSTRCCCVRCRSRSPRAFCNWRRKTTCCASRHSAHPPSITCRGRSRRGRSSSLGRSNQRRSHSPATAIPKPIRAATSVHRCFRCSVCNRSPAGIFMKAKTSLGPRPWRLSANRCGGDASAEMQRRSGGPQPSTASRTRSSASHRRRSECSLPAMSGSLSSSIRRKKSA